MVIVHSDEPLILPKIISDTLEPFKDLQVNNVNVLSITNSLDAFKNKNNVKVVFNNHCYLGRNGDNIQKMINEN